MLYCKNFEIIMESLHFITSCEVCGNEKLIDALNLGMHPLCDDLIRIGENIECIEYPIDILYCPVCKTAHQRYQVNKSTLFTQQYHYRARVTKSVVDGMRGLVEGAEKRYGSLTNKKVLDIGCNDGSLLDIFHEKGCITYGVEPTGAAEDASGNHQIINGYFDDTVALMLKEKEGSFDIITFTNVFAHIEDLPGLISNLQSISSKDTVIIIENHYLGDIIERGQFDTFYHEHPRTYSYKSFEVIAKSLGMNVSDVEFVSRYGGNIRVHISQNPKHNLTIDEDHFLDGLRAMSLDIDQWKEKIKCLIDEETSRNGPMPAKAFPGRAAILVKLLGLDETKISAVYEIKGSIKTGYYVPGTKIPILPEKDLYAKIKPQRKILNLAWHISSEVRQNLRKNGYLAEVLDVR